MNLLFVIDPEPPQLMMWYLDRYGFFDVYVA